MRDTVKIFNIDFNWGDHGAAEPGLFTQADPEEQVDLGANAIQTFCVSYNGYAWYPSEVAPVNPGLKHPDYLGETIKASRRLGMRTLGYFTLGANPWWEQRHPELVHGADSDYIKIPFTREYLDFFCRSVADALRKEDVDGFMMDWVRPTRHAHWLACEQQMFRELMGEKFPAAGQPSQAVELEFNRRAIERAWVRVRETVLATRRVIIWTNHPFLEEERAMWQGHRLLKEVDWVLNEGPDPKWLDWLKQQAGPRTLVIQNLCGWKEHDALMWRDIDPRLFGFYGFAKADAKTTLPSPALPMNIKNIEIVREAYHRL